jgi:hypothetical protein
LTARQGRPVIALGFRAKQWLDIWAPKAELVETIKYGLLHATLECHSVGSPWGQAKVAPLRLQFQHAVSAAPLIAGPLLRQPMRAEPHHMPIHTCSFKETLRYSTTRR